MTFILKDEIVCVGKFAVEKQDTEVNRRLHYDSKNSKLFIIKPDGEYKKLADLKEGGYDMISNAIKKHWNYVDLSEYEI
mgnify:CR=1 FL=1